MITIESLARTYGVKRLGCLTLTFNPKSGDLTDMREAQRRFHSLTTGVLNQRFPERVWVAERCKSGTIHFHLVVVMRGDIQTGFNFEDVAQRKYGSVSKELRDTWAFLRSILPKYGFARHELKPVRTNEVGLAKYFAKYIAKNIGNRQEIDKGARLFGFSRGTARGSSKFSWVDGKKSDLWRQKLGIFCKGLGFTSENYGQKLREGWGSNWAYLLGKAVISIKLESYSTYAIFELDYPNSGRHGVMKDSSIPRGEVWSFWGDDDDPYGLKDVDISINGGRDARESLRAAITFALDERARLNDMESSSAFREIRLSDNDSYCSLDPETVLKVQFASWIELSTKDD